MRITAKDIACKQFPTAPEGLDPEEVYAFLEVIREEMYAREKENSVLKEKVMALRDKAKIMDSTISAILLLLEQAKQGRSRISVQRTIGELFNMLSPLRKTAR